MGSFIRFRRRGCGGDRAEIDEEFGWTEDWLNDAVKGFLSANETLDFYASYPNVIETGRLQLYVLTPQYMSATKCMAMPGGRC
jgi:hypothetical protein